MRRRDAAPLFNNCRQEEATHAATLPPFSTFVTFLGYYSARVRIKAERGGEKKEASHFFSCRFMLFHKHNLPHLFEIAQASSSRYCLPSFPPRVPRRPRADPLHKHLSGAVYSLHAWSPTVRSAVKPSIKGAVAEGNCIR